ncbi:MAG: hypothetical protein CML73_02295 [Rhodobiaceae bacterium]|nr:hypothetical protein [Rhodobiaceae bacterium]
MAAVRGVNASNYVAAGRAATNNFINTVGAVFDNSPNYTKIGETKVREEAKTKIEARKADAVVAEAGIKAERDFRIAQYKLDSANAIVKAQESNRKAGIIAAASENIFDAFKKQREPYMPDYSKYDDYFNKIDADIAARDAKNRDPNNTFGIPEPIPAPLPQPLPPLPTFTPANSSPAPRPNTYTDPSISIPNGTSTSLQSSLPSSAFKKTSTSQPLSLSGFRGEVYDYLTGYHQLNQNQALGIIANIDRESSFRINPPGGDGGNSFGLLQWNNALGRSQRMKLNVPDWKTNWKGQLDHALSQNQESIYNEFVERYKTTDYPTPEAASEAFLREWERPEKTELDIKKNNQFLQGYSQSNFI